jgi:hypothetical protein
MSSLEFLYTLPIYWKDFIYTLGAIDPMNKEMIDFDINEVDPCLTILFPFKF